MQQVFEAEQFNVSTPKNFLRGYISQLLKTKAQSKHQLLEELN